MTDWTMIIASNHWIWPSFNVLTFERTGNKAYFIFLGLVTISFYPNSEDARSGDAYTLWGNQYLDTLLFAGFPLTLLFLAWR